MTRTLPLLLAALVAVVSYTPLAAQSPPGAGGAAPADSAAVASVIDQFHDALVRGDSARALALLSPDARILEGGGIETVAEYASHHLPADMAFAGAVDRERASLQVVVRGDVAWAMSTSRARGRYRDRDIDSRGAELVVLSRREGAWRIEAIHWSSR
jgi:ketosteroid isomerase-like protein